MAIQRIGGVIAAVVMAIVAFNFYNPLVAGADTIHREFDPHCLFDTGETTKIIHQVDSVTKKVTAKATLTDSSGECKVTAATGKWYTESGTEINIATENTWPSTSTSQWATPDNILTRFGNINKLVISLAPLLIVVGMLTMAASLGLQAATGIGNLGASIIDQVVGLAVALVAVNMAPSFFDGVVTASTVHGGQFSVTAFFGAIQNIIMGLIPLIAVLGFVGYLVIRGYFVGRQFAGNRMGRMNYGF